MNASTYAWLCTATFLSSSTWAQNFESTIDSKISTSTLDSVIVFDSSGTIIGDYDPEMNPGGTQTRPGIFGGSGNQPINTSVSLSADTLLDTNPAGSFNFVPDFDAGLVEIDGLVADLINGAPSTTNLTATMLYNTFHTINPSFIYLGGTPIDVPIGEIGGITQAILTQTNLGAGTLTPTGDPDVFTIDLLIPAQLDMVVDTALPGEDPLPTPIDPLPMMLPVGGQVEILGNGSVLITLELTPDPISMVIPLDGAAVPDVPFELPTFGTETASVIYSSVPESVGVDASLGMVIVANGTASCAADINGDGQLNFFDVSNFLSAFGAMDSAADFTNDGLFNFFDVSAFLAAFAVGCP